MKFCPYCGADLMDSTVSFCSECGKALPGEQKEEIPVSGSDTKKTREKKKKKQPRKRKAKTKQAAELEGPPDDGYDGYYDDIRPIDEGHQREGMDKGLVKKVVLLIVSVGLIIAACVAIMYLL